LPSRIEHSKPPRIEIGREKAIADVASCYPDLSYLGKYVMLEKRISQLAEGD
jgi:hypothetical protein